MDKVCCGLSNLTIMDIVVTKCIYYYTTLIYSAYVGVGSERLQLFLSVRRLSQMSLDFHQHGRLLL